MKHTKTQAFPRICHSCGSQRVFPRPVTSASPRTLWKMCASGPPSLLAQNRECGSSVYVLVGPTESLTGGWTSSATGRLGNFGRELTMSVDTHCRPNSKMWLEDQNVKYHLCCQSTKNTTNKWEIRGWMEENGIKSSLLHYHQGSRWKSEDNI